MGLFLVWEEEEASNVCVLGDIQARSSMGHSSLTVLMLQPRNQCYATACCLGLPACSHDSCLDICYQATNCLPCLLPAGPGILPTFTLWVASVTFATKDYSFCKAADTFAEWPVVSSTWMALDDWPWHSQEFYAQKPGLCHLEEAGPGLFCLFISLFMSGERGLSWCSQHPFYSSFKV